MNSMYSLDWNTWLPAANVAFARILQAKDVKNYEPCNRDFTDLCMFPLGDDDAAVKTLRQLFQEEGPFNIALLGMDDQSRSWIQCYSAIEKFMLFVSQEQRTIFLRKYGHLALDRALNQNAREPKSQSDLDTNQWVDISCPPVIVDWHDGEWLVVDTGDL